MTRVVSLWYEEAMQIHASEVSGGSASELRSLWERSAPALLDRFSLFSFLLAFGVLNHIHTVKGFAPSYSNVGTIVLIGAAAALLIRPSNRFLFTTMSVALAVDVFVQMPAVVNHWLAYGVMAASFSVIALVSARHGGHKGDFYSGAILFAAAGTIVTLWALAAFHKLNEGFFDTVYGCASSHANDLTDLIGLGRPIDGGPISALLIALAISTEAAVPIMLVFRRTRSAGIILAFMFHVVMGINGHQTFSGLTFAAYVPFLPATVLDRLIAPTSTNRSAWRTVQLAGVGLVTLGAMLTLAGRNYTFPEYRRGIYLIVAIVIAAAVAKAWRTQKHEPVSALAAEIGRLDLRARRAAIGITTGLVFLLGLNGLAGYLGAKTQLTVSMYSNLEVSTAEHWNHFIVPPQVRFFGSDADLIEVIEIDHPGAAQLIGVRTDQFEIRREVAPLCGADPIVMQYRAGDSREVFSLEDACESSFGENPAFWERKLLTFRPVIDPNSCQW